MRGFFGGVISGLLVLAAVAVLFSKLSPALPRPEIAAQAPAVSRGADPSGAETGVASHGADADLVELAPAAPSGDTAKGDDLAALAGADTQPAEKPQVGAETGGLTGPSETPGAADVAVAGESPVSPTVPADAPGAPSGDSEPSVATQPAQPAMPSLGQDDSGFGTGADGDAGAAPEVSAATDDTPDNRSAGATPVPGTEPSPDRATQSTDRPAADAGENAVSSAPEVAQTAPQEPEEPSEDTAGESGSRLAALPQAGGGDSAGAPRIGTRVVPLTDRDAAVAEAPAAAEEAAPQGPPIEAHAAEFENPEGKPLMSIVLIDDEASVGGEALADFPYPISIAIDPLAPDAAEKLARHRAAGLEVVAIADMPAAATPQDAEVAMSVWMETLPQVVAVLEGTDTGVQGNRELSDQVTAIVKAAGLGIILQDSGLNTAHKMAVRDGVPAALVFRDFDGAGQTPDIMRRFLDQAAFRAGTQGAVIMLGRVRPDTISALTLWGLQDRAGRVALAPVSAVLTMESN